MELDREIQIKIYSVEHPQLFWFRSVSDDDEIHSRLRTYLEQHDKTEKFVPKKDDVVIVHINNRHFFASVKETRNDSRIVKVSILESGHTRRVSIGNIIELKDQQLKELAGRSVLRGALTGIHPTESIYDCLTSSPKIADTQKWSPQTIAILKTQIKVSDAVYFQATKKIDDTKFGGILTFKLNAVQLLIISKHAKRDSDIDGDDVDVNETETESFLGEDVSDDISDTHPVIGRRKGTLLEDSVSLEQSGDESSVEKRDASTSEETSDWSESPTESRNVTLSNIGDDEQSKEGSDEQIEKSNIQPLNAALLVEERSREDEEMTTTTQDGSIDVPAYLLEDSATEDEPEQYEYEWSPKVEKERTIGVQNALKKHLIGSLLQNATLTSEEPYVYSEHKIDPDAQLAYCVPYIEELKRLNKVYPVQATVWPYIKSGRSAILIGNTDFYPHLLYMPPILNLIMMLEDLTKPKIKGPNVVIFASNCQEAQQIQQICSCFLKENSVYTDATDYTVAFNEQKYEKCSIYVSLMSRLSHDPEKHVPQLTQRIILNNFHSVPSKKRQKIINSILNLDVNVLVTSRHYVEELRTLFDQIPNMFVSIQSYFELFNFSSNEKGSRTTDIRIFEPKSKDKLVKLTKKLDHLKGKVVIACCNSRTAEHLSKVLLSDYKIATICNEKPLKGAIKVLICSDDQIARIDVRNANNLIHYGLPDDFDTFCRRYSVLRSNISLEKQSTLTVKPSSIIFGTLHSELNTKILLLFIILFREYGYTMTPPKHKEFLLEKLRRTNFDAPLCMDIATTYTNVGHLLDCKYRHFFENSVKCGESVFAEPKTCQVQILKVLSPVCVSVRLIKSKGTATNDWQQHFMPDPFDRFNKEFTKFYASNFAPVHDATEINDNKLYVLRDGNNYYRCRIFTKSNDGTQLRVRLVDFGKYHTTDALNIGTMKTDHTKYAPQSSDLCLLNVVPWNKLWWDDYDTEFASNTLKKLNPSNIFETIILWGVQPDMLFALNLFVPDDGNYVDIITQKGIGAIKNNIEDFDDFFKHAMQQKVLTVDQRNNIQQSLQ